MAKKRGFKPARGSASGPENRRAAGDADNPDEEAQMASYIGTHRRRHDNLDATRLYLSEIGFSPLLSAEEEVYYARRARKGDEAGRRRMIEMQVFVSSNHFTACYSPQSLATVGRLWLIPRL